MLCGQFRLGRWQGQSKASTRIRSWQNPGILIHLPHPRCLRLHPRPVESHSSGPRTQPDVAGYLLYRSTDPKGPWTKLTPTLYTKTTFTDENVESGKTYYYYLEAVDTAGNVSPKSEIVSETVP